MKLKELKELKDFKTTPYYKYYTEMVDDYSIKIINSIITQQWIDAEKKYTRWDVLKEVRKFINTDLRQFKDLDVINPNKEEEEKKKLEDLLQKQAKQILGMD